MTTTWHDELRDAWRPSAIKLLLVGESAPDGGALSENRRFFSAPKVSRYDNLFRAVVEALYDVRVQTGSDRSPLLKRLREDGVFLIDLVPYPVNKLGGTERSAALRLFGPERSDEIQRLAPAAIVICHTPTYRILAPELIRRDLPLLHREPIPFPLPNHRSEFVRRVRLALGR